MKNLLAAAIALTVTLGSAANPGERVDFFAQVVGIHHNSLRVQQAQTGAVWTINLANRRDQGPGDWRERYVHSFQMGQQIRVLGIQVDYDRIRADELQPAYASNQPDYNQPDYPPQQGGFYVQNPPQGAGLPPNFNVQGQAFPYAQIRVEVQPQQSFRPGQIRVPGRAWEVYGQADPSGHFDVPVDSTRVGPCYLRLTVSASDQCRPVAQPTVIDVVRR